MQFKTWLEACSLGCSYGGMPDSGGFSCNTEYEIGGQRIAEAAHCILGSLGRIKPGQIGTAADYEKDHIEEELGIILNAMDEYSRSLYSDRVIGNRNYGAKTVESIQGNAPKLKARAVQMVSQLEIKDVQIRNIAEASYTVIAVLADALLDSVKDYPRSMSNAFDNPLLRNAVAKLKRTINEVY